jgi:hypothetical protein
VIAGLLAPASLTLGFLAVCATWFLGTTEHYHALIARLAPDPFAFPFLDAHVVLAWAECAQRGIDVTITNPCDILGRTLAQSPLWLALGPLGATVSLTNIAGLLTGLLFLASLFLLPPARTPAQAAFLFPAFLSPAVAYGLERANTDLLVFAAVIAGARLAASPRTATRVAGHGAVLLAGLLKFYPLAALALLLRETPDRALGLAFAAALALAALRALALFQLWAILLPHIPARFARDSWLVLSWFLAQAAWWGLAGALGALLLALAPIAHGKPPPAA